MEDIREMLKKVAAGELSVDNAVLELKKEPFTAAGYDDRGCDGLLWGDHMH